VPWLSESAVQAPYWSLRTYDLAPRFMTKSRNAAQTRAGRPTGGAFQVGVELNANASATG
jgi:hypothetical protein